MIEKILPAAAVGRDTVVDPPDVMLFPEEEAFIGRAVDKRRHEFCTVRHCAREALVELGVPAVALLPGPRGAPRWPPGVVGSMTHCAGYRAAAVARRQDLLTIGIDAEPHDTLPSGVLGYVALNEEQASIAALRASNDRVCWDRLLFCIKETVYKAWFPITGRWLGFEQALVTISPCDANSPAPSHPGTPSHPGNHHHNGNHPHNHAHTHSSTPCDPNSGQGSFSVRFLVEPPVIDGLALTGFEGRWLVSAGLMIAATATPARHALGAPRPASGPGDTPAGMPGDTTAR